MQNAGTHSFSIGITEVLNTNLLIELTADDIEYVYQRSILFSFIIMLVNPLHHVILFCFMVIYGFLLCRSPGKILNVTVPTFETLSQFGVASVTTKNIGGLEASYSLTVIETSGSSLPLLFALSCYLMTGNDIS